jgi:hypothetical protein
MLYLTLLFLLVHQEQTLLYYQLAYQKKPFFHVYVHFFLLLLLFVQVGLLLFLKLLFPVQQ